MHRWAERDPAAAARLAAAREAIGALATEHRLPVENLLAPDAVRRLAWEPPSPATAAAIGAMLAGYGARPWQAGAHRRAAGRGLRGRRGERPARQPPAAEPGAAGRP